MTRTTQQWATQQQAEEETTWENPAIERCVFFINSSPIHCASNHKSGLPRLPKLLTSNSVDVAWKSTQLPENAQWIPLISEDSFNIFPLSYSYLHLDQVDVLSYGENIEKNHLQMSTCRLPQKVATQQLLSLWRSCHGQLSKASLAGSITSITACSFRTSTGSFHWLSSTLSSPPLHIDLILLASSNL